MKVLAEHNGKDGGALRRGAVARPAAGHHLAGVGPGPVDAGQPTSSGFPVEWSMAGAMLDPKDLTAAIEFEQNRAAGISSHYAEHSLIPPPAVERAIEGATAEPGRGDRGRHPDRGPVPRPDPAGHLRGERGRVPGAGPGPGRRLRRADELRAGPPARAGAAAAGVRAGGAVVDGRVPAAAAGEVPGLGDAARGRRGRHADRALPGVRDRLGPPGGAVRPALRPGDAAAAGAVHHHRRAGRRQARADRGAGLQRGPPR